MITLKKGVRRDSLFLFQKNITKLLEYITKNSYICCVIILKHAIMKKHERISGIMPSGHGHYRITIQFRNKAYSSLTSNMPDLDLFRSNDRGWKAAGENLYNEVVRNNNLR